MEQSQHTAASKSPSGIKIGIASGILSGLLIVSAGLYLTHNANHTANLSAVSTSNKQPNLTNPTTNNQPDNQPSNSPTSNTPQPSNSPTTTYSTSTNTPKAPTTTTPTKPAPTATGIEVLTPDPGANQILYIPSCEFNPPLGNPPPCTNYKPISFNLVETYSDGSTSRISWSAATITSYNSARARSNIPDLLNINSTNNTLELGTAPGYFLGNYTSDAVVPINVTYQQWSYTKYIHIYVT